MVKLKAIWRGLKNWQKAIVIFLALGLFGGLLPKEEQAATATASKTAQNAPAPVTASPPKEPEKPYAEAALTEASVTKASGLKDVTKVEIIPDGVENGKHIIYVYYTMGASWDENAVVRNAARDAVKIMEKLFAHPEVSRVGLWAQGTFTDQYGKESTETAVRIVWNRETADKVEWKNFANMIVTEPKRAYNLAEHYQIHAGVYSRITDKIGFPASK